MSTETRASYTDTFSHAFDAKGRITVPSEWRQASFEENLFVLPSSDACVRVYPASWMARLQEQMATLKDSDPIRKQVQALAAMAQSASWDQQGRIMVKEKLRQKAGLKKEAVLVGRFDHFEIWDKAVWQKKPEAATTIEDAMSVMGL